ncbi:MAG TPA: hypothetical protein DEF51_35790, partial [Myxococcales bacterium]|nr:hypothetical protein [Myxococcales bacterium]
MRCLERWWKRTLCRLRRGAEGSSPAPGPYRAPTAPAPPKAPPPERSPPPAPRSSRPAPRHGWALGCLVSLAMGCGFLTWFVEALGHAHGRPWRRAGRRLEAGARRRDDWTGGAAPDVDALEPMARETLAAAWTEVARDEHASVGAFADLSQRLLAAGAPPSLIAQCHRAAIEEIDHAQRAFGIAGAYAGRPIGPAALEMPAAGKRDGSLPELAVETLLD